MLFNFRLLINFNVCHDSTHSTHLPSIPSLELLVLLGGTDLEKVSD